MADTSKQLQQQIIAAQQSATPLMIQGGGSKSFLGHRCQGQPLDVASHSGIVNYEPDEVIITVRAGTPLTEVETTLHDGGQMLAFEPPHFTENATIGGTVACGLSGPARPYAGAVRDFVLGMRIINGSGEILSFGGQVIKNVAGYDVSRLQTGAMGTLGVILDVTFKVLPVPAASITVACDSDPAAAIRTMNELAGQPVPLSAACYIDSTLYLRLSGAEQGVAVAAQKIGGERVEQDQQFWADIANHRHSFFHASENLWRISVPPATAPLPLAGETLLDWGGAQRWLHSVEDPVNLRQVVAEAGGHATLFRTQLEDDIPRFQPLAAGLHELQSSVKHAFDPSGILNPGKIYLNL